MRSRERRIITPEHVEIRLDPAGLGSRFIALLVDFVLITALAGTISQVTLLLLPQAPALLLRALLLLILTWGYHVYFEVAHAGRSPGKRLTGLRVVDGRGLPLGLEQSFVRNVVRVIDAAPLGYALGGVACLFDPDRRRLGDIAADTLVVRDVHTPSFERRSTRGGGLSYLRTPRLVRLVRHRVGLEEREFLAALAVRAEGLEDRARFDLMDEVGRYYRERLEIDDPSLSGENLVRGLAGILFSGR